MLLLELCDLMEFEKMAASDTTIKREGDIPRFLRLLASASDLHNTSWIFSHDADRNSTMYAPPHLLRTLRF